MQLPGRLTTVVLAAGLVLSSLPTGPAGATGRTAPAGTTTDSDTNANINTDTDSTVTLLTGDRVTVTGSGGVAVRPGPGRDRIRFLTRRDRDRLSVVPSDAVPLIRAGRLDDRLFDVTGLVDAGAHPDAAALPPAVGAEAVDPAPVDHAAAEHPVVIEHRNADGTLAADYSTQLVSLDSWFSQEVYDPDGVAELRLPPGRYALSSTIWVADADGNWTEVSILNQPEVVVDDDTDRIVVDAGKARPVRMTVPEPTARPALVDLTTTIVTETGLYSFSLWTESLDGLAVGRIGPARRSDEFLFSIGSQWVAAGNPGESPYLYALSEAFPHRMPTGFARDYRHRDLATVTQTFRGDQQRTRADRYVIPEIQIQGWDVDGATVAVPVTLPGQRIERYNTDRVRWTSRLDLGWPGQDGGPGGQVALLDWSASYRPGRSAAQEWHAAPYGPVLPASDWPDLGLARRGDQISLDVPMHADAAGHPGDSLSTSARTALYRDGELVGEMPYQGYGHFQVPPDAAAYRLETVARRGFTDLSTEVAASWTFRSGPVAGEDHVKLPAMMVRFAPRLDAQNTAPAGRRFTIPVTVQRQPGAPAPTVRSLTVQVSYDGGSTWQEAAVTASGAGWRATVQHPAGSSHASLRATATDRAGNTVTQHIVNAYRLG